MHPSVILSVWLSAVLLVQVLPVALLGTAGLVVLAISSSPVRARFQQLIKRSRWILLTLLLTFVLLTPGERLVADYPVTKEGLASGLEHLLRLLSVLVAVAWLVGGRSVAWLLSAMLGLLESFGVSRGRGFIVRLALTLRDSAVEGGRQSWKSMLTASEPEGLEPPLDHFELEHQALSPAERWLAAGFLLAGFSSLLITL